MKAYRRIDVSILVAFLTIGLCYGVAWGVLDKAGAVAHFDNGVNYQVIEQWDWAIDEYIEAIELNPEYAEAYNNRGHAYQSKGQFDKAISDYNKAIEINPRYAKAYANRAFAYRSKGEYDKALEDFRKAESLGHPVSQGFSMTLREALEPIREKDFPLEVLAPFVLVGVAIPVIVILITKMADLYDMKRKETLETTARELGLEYGQSAYIDKVCYEAGFPLFKERSAQIADCMYGKHEDAGVAIFKHSYEKSMGEYQGIYTHIGVHFSSQTSLFPSFAMFPTEKDHRWVTSFLNSGSIDPKLGAGFEKNYVVRGSDENQIRHLFTDDLLDYFSRHPGFFVQAIGNQLIVYMKTGIWDSKADVKWLFDQAKTIYDLLCKGVSEIAS